MAYWRHRLRNARHRLKHEGWRGVIAACRREIQGQSPRATLYFYRVFYRESGSNLKRPHKKTPPTNCPLQKKKHNTQQSIDSQEYIKNLLYSLKMNFLNTKELSREWKKIDADIHNNRHI